jgi:peptidoglycan hydrolase-like protein with peptidoglycan-binding domain
MSRAAALRRTGKVLGGVLGLAALAAGVVGVWLATVAKPRAAAGTATPVTMGTAVVARGTVAERMQVTGVLGFAGWYPVVHQGGSGVLTAVAAAGVVVHRGGRLYAVANQPVHLLYGTVPAYRDLVAGVSDGPDVRQLEKNLVALGMDPHHQVTVDAHFTSATAAAVRRWQAAWGLPAGQRTGGIPLGQVVFQPGPLRVAQVQATVGTTVGPDHPVLTATSMTPVVTAQLPADRRYLVHLHDRVTVTLTGVASFPGTVTAVGRAATAPSGPDANTPSMVPVTVAVTVPASAGDLDEAPVEVAITRQTHRDVLLVPVAAVQARPGGGYQVRLDSGRYVPVEPGLFDSLTSMVEVTGDLTAGERVKVPAP